jgi:hypothetical protein
MFNYCCETLIRALVFYDIYYEKVKLIFNKHYIHEEIMGKLKLGNACCNIRHTL